MNEAMLGVAGKKLQQIVNIGFSQPSRGWTIVTSNLNLSELAGKFEMVCKDLRYATTHSYHDQCGAFGQSIGFWVGAWKRKERPGEIADSRPSPFTGNLQNAVLRFAQQAFKNAFSDGVSDDTEISAVVLVITLIYSQAPKLDQGLDSLATELVADLPHSQIDEQFVDLAEYGHPHWQLLWRAFAVS